MRLSRFFVDTPLQEGSYELPSSLAHYMTRVLRLPMGAPVQLFDGSGREFLGEITQITKKTVVVSLIETLKGLADSRLYTHLGQGLSRGEKMDFVIQKATELGVSEITPLITERCEVRLSDERADKRLAHWQQVAVSACEQSGRTTVPIINAPKTMADWLACVKADLKLMLHPVSKPMASYASPSSLALLIGPEGGFSETELTLAATHDFQHVQLGPRVLRTETAPLAALSIAQSLWGDFR